MVLQLDNPFSPYESMTLEEFESWGLSVGEFDRSTPASRIAIVEKYLKSHGLIFSQARCEHDVPGGLQTPNGSIYFRTPVWIHEFVWLDVPAPAKEIESSHSKGNLWVIPVIAAIALVVFFAVKRIF